MTNCNVTLALSYGSSQPYVGEHLRVGPVVPFVDASYWVTREFEDIPLTNPPMVRAFVQGQQYGFIEPDGTQVVKTIPATGSANYAAIASTTPSPVPPDTLDSLTADLISGASDTRTAIGELLGSTDSREQMALAGHNPLVPFWSRLATRATRLVNIGLLGPSVTEGAFVGTFDRTPGQLLQRLLHSKHPTPGLTGGGRGYIGVPSTALTTSPNYPAGMWPLAFTGGSIDPIDPAASAFDAGAKHAIWYTNGTGKGVLTLANPVTSFDIHHIVGASGGATAGYYKIDGGAAVPFSTYAAATAAQALHVALPATSTIEVGWNAAGYIIVSGIREYNGDEAKGIQVHNFGHAGFKLADFTDGAAIAGSWRAEIAGFGLDLLVLSETGINDGSNGVTAAAYKTQLTAFIATLRAGGITCPIVIGAAYDVSGVVTLASPWQAYVTAMREVVAADPTLILVDHSARMPATNAAQTYGLFHADGVHPAASGGANQFMQEVVAAAIAPR